MITDCFESFHCANGIYKSGFTRVLSISKDSTAFAFRYSRPMLNTDSALYDLFAASVFVAAFHSRPMLDTDTALLDMIVASILAAAFHYRPMLDTDTALLDLIAAPVLVAAFTRTPLLVMPHA